MCGHFAFLCVHKVCLSFCASDIKLCMPGCPSVLVWLRFKYATNAHRSTSHHFFTRKKQPCTFPVICSDPCTTATSKARNQQLLAITGTSTVDGDMKQLFWASRSCIMHYMCSHTCANWKAFNLELWLFKRCQGGIETKIKFIFHVEKEKSGNPLKTWNSLMNESYVS